MCMAVITAQFKMVANSAGKENNNGGWGHPEGFNSPDVGKVDS